MPDMAYSRAIETYNDPEFFKEANINFNGLPVPGTIARGESAVFHLAKDASGDTVNYYSSRQISNPVPVPDSAGLVEAERLYLVNCAICHGSKLDGNGPLYKDGDGPYLAKPANFIGDPKIVGMPDGQMFYSITYGKNLMGGYASQLTREQRWEVIHYIRSKQKKNQPAESDSEATASVK
jgi:mono/diheme cytochrome c family protein